MLFIQVNDLVVWDIIIDDSSIPLKQKGELSIPKSKKEWNKEDRRSIQLNAKVMHTLFCTLSQEEYNRVLSCLNANEIWDKLEVTHECTSQVKKSKVEILTLNYEAFKMKPREDIKAMSNQFSIIINGLMSYGKTYPNEKVARNIQSLPR
ncbi:hypothetical protein J1N35_022920 [Gossypium stocksii]|uniref:UBN2 domain-containing protein n=1 Tax=Gossypium stocksii TaxID=47602 RepID=A0A9D3VIR5_9ROSI|nr:hypothetical protein J1N35_022920 [Gossypium stocksii]